MGSELNQQQIIRKVNDAGYTHTSHKLSLDPTSVLIDGQVNFDEFPSGLRVHVTDAVEHSSGHISSEISPMISMNCLLEGEINFSLDNKVYTFIVDNESVIFVNLITRPQIFKRMFNPGIKVKKLNISAEESWLLARCSKPEDKAAIKHLFALDPSVISWPCLKSHKKLVLKLMSLTEKKSLSARLETESLAVQLMLNFYQQLIRQDIYNREKFPHEIQLKTQADNKYEDRIDKLLDRSLTLEQLSNELGASISTLQRYFKTKYRLTVKEYVRNQKLELARRSLLFENKSIGEVAYAAGYNHSSNFIKAFKRYFSMTPKEILNQHSVSN